MSAFGVKRTLVGAATMSAFDPKRTFDPVPPKPQRQTESRKYWVRRLRWIKLRLSNVPNAVRETIAGDVARLLVVFPDIEWVAFVSPLLAAIVTRDDAVVAHWHRAGRSHQGR